MGWRNPVTEAADPVARAAAAAAMDQATNGIIPGSRLAADAIDGKTITGSTFRTASAGRRVVIDHDTGDRVEWFTGDAQEAVPGRLYVGKFPGETSTTQDRGYLMLAPPELGASVLTPEASLVALGQSRDGTTRGQWLITGAVEFGSSPYFTSDDPADVIFGVAGGWTSNFGCTYRQVRGDTEVSFALAGSWAAGLVLATLPPGRRPFKEQWFNGYWNGVLKTDVHMYPDGRIVLTNAGTAGVVCSAKFRSAP